MAINGKVLKRVVIVLLVVPFSFASEPLFAQKMHAVVVGDLSPAAGWGKLAPNIVIDTLSFGGMLESNMPEHPLNIVGNHDFDLGPDGLAKAIGVAAKSGRIPTVIASNTDFSKDDPTLVDLQRLAKDGVIRQQMVIERGGIRFGIFGLMGKESIFYANGAGAVTLPDPVETTKSMVRLLRERDLLEYLLVENPAHPGEYFPRTSGLRFRYDTSRPRFDVVTAIEMGDLDRGYREIDITGKDTTLL